MSDLVDKIIPQFNTWKFKRAQPYRLEDIKKIILTQTKHNLPIPLFGYWGVGDKGKIDKFEVETLKHLNEMKAKVEEVYPPSFEILFIISDIHAMGNCIPKDKFDSYIIGVKNLFAEFGFQSVLLSELYEEYDLSLQKAKNFIEKKGRTWWQTFAFRKELIKQAINVSLCERKELSAKTYTGCRLCESRILEKEYSTKIFTTYSSPCLSLLYPDLPTLYLYSWKRKCSEVPWFKKS